jgi:hypothetical protein
MNQIVTEETVAQYTFDVAGFGRHPDRFWSPSRPKVFAIDAQLILFIIYLAFQPI